jgi:hypothetical protein
MTVRLTHLLSVLALCAATPALAQSSSDASGALSMSGPPNLSMSLVVDDTSSSSSSEEVDLSVSSDEPSSSDEMSHMSEPPNFSKESSSEEMSSEDLSSEEEPSSEEPPVGPPLASADALKLFFDTCTDLSSGDLTAYDRANDSGWTPNEQDDVGPYNSVYSGWRNVEGYGEIDVWGSVNSYPTQALGYCRVDFPDPDNRIDFRDMSQNGGLKGRLEDRGEGNVYGAWESDDHKLLVLADRNAGQVQIEFNLLLGDKKK